MQKIVVHNFLRIPQSTFPLLHSTVQMESSWSSTQTITTTSSNIIEFFVQTPFVEASEMTIDLLVHKTVFHNFCGFRKVRFHCYSPQLKWNQADLPLKQWRRPALTSLKLSFKHHLWKPQQWRLINWCKRLLFTIFCGYGKVRFHYYSPQFKWNHTNLLLKQWRQLLLTSLKLSFK